MAQQPLQRLAGAGEPGSPSTSSTVAGCASSGSRSASSVRRCSACAGSRPKSRRQSWPWPGRRCGSQSDQAQSAVRRSACCRSSALTTTRLSPLGGCRVASWASRARASPSSRTRGPATPRLPARRRSTVTGTAGSTVPGVVPGPPARSAVPRRRVSASGWAGTRSQSRGPGPSALSSRVAGSGQRSRSAVAWRSRAWACCWAASRAPAGAPGAGAAARPSRRASSERVRPAPPGAGSSGCSATGGWAGPGAAG